MTLTRERTRNIQQELVEERKTQLIDGVEVEMATANSRHGKTAGKIYYLLLSYILQQQLQDDVYIENLTLHIDDNIEYIPDIMLVNEKVDDEYDTYYGIPELVVEIASPSTVKLDLTTKRIKYAELGIPEYWTVDPISKQIIVWINENNLFNVYEIYQLPPPNAKNVSEYKTKINTLYYGDKLTLDLYDIFKGI